jgi:hypothetical protein
MSGSEARARALRGESWAEFCDALKQAGAAILAEGTPTDPLDRAEGFRYLSRLTRAALESFLEYADPAAPALHRPVHETAKIGADNPDNHYLRGAISGQHEYRIRGKRGSVHYLSFAAQSPGVAQTGDSQQSGYLEASDLEIAPDGSFEIALSREPRPGNWLPLAESTDSLIVRQTFLDRTREVPAELAIERVDGDGRPAPFTPERLDAGLRAAAALVNGCSQLFAGWVRGFERHANELPLFDPKLSLGAGGDPNITYYHSYWRLAPDEALLVEVTPPPCESWNFQLDNWWMESLDYRFHRIHVNKHTARYEPDGSVRIAVAHEDPGPRHPNWIATAGHRHGTMCFRWIRAKEHPQPRTRVVKLAELRAP